MKSLLHLTIASLLLLTCCTTEEKLSMAGVWESHSLTITMHSWQGGDSSVVITATPETWLETMQMQPIKSYLNTDQTYFAEYRDLAGNLTNRPSGTWTLVGNILTYHEKIPKPEMYVQTVTKLNETLYQLSSNLDFDEDGEFDDEVLAIYRKVE